VEWIRLAQDRDQWRGLVSTVMSLRVTQRMGNLLISWASYLLEKSSKLLYAEDATHRVIIEATGIRFPIASSSPHSNAATVPLNWHRPDEQFSYRSFTVILPFQSVLQMWPAKRRNKPSAKPPYVCLSVSPSNHCSIYRSIHRKVYLTIHHFTNRLIRISLYSQFVCP
jgi:hypothetical protein